MATISARRALEDAGLTADDLDMIICCTFTSDTLCPSAACQVQNNLGVSRPIPAFDLSAACSGFIYGCSVAASFIRAGVYTRVLVIGVDALSTVVDWNDRNTCVLFADGGGAAIAAPSKRAAACSAKAWARTAPGTTRSGCVRRAPPIRSAAATPSTATAST